MKILLDIATILGGIAALLFFWDKLITSRLDKKSQDGLKNNGRIEGQVGKPVSEAAPASEDLLIRQRIIDSILRPSDRYNDSVWFIFATPVYCCVGAVIMCLVTIYVSLVAGMLTSLISIILGMIGVKLSEDFSFEDAASLLTLRSYIIGIAGMAGVVTIGDNGLNLSDPTVRNIYIAAEVLGCTLLGTLSVIIRVVRRRHKK